MNHRKKEHADQVVLALGAHPDDLEMGCGGTLAVLASAGIRVIMAVVSIPSKLELRKEESLRAAEILGCEVRFLVPDRLTRVEDLKSYQLIGMIDELVLELSPTAVFSHCQSNSHLDHKLVYDASLASQRVKYFDHYCYSPTSCRPMNIPFSATGFVDISDTFDIKMNSIQAHASQFEQRALNYNHVQELNQHNGLLIGVKYAEGFQIERTKIDLNTFFKPLSKPPQLRDDLDCEDSVKPVKARK